MTRAEAKATTMNALCIRLDVFTPSEIVRCFGIERHVLTPVFRDDTGLIRRVKSFRLIVLNYLKHAQIQDEVVYYIDRLTHIYYLHTVRYGLVSTCGRLRTIFIRGERK